MFMNKEVKEMNKRKFTLLDYLLGIGLLVFIISGGFILPFRAVTLVYVYNGFWTWQNILMMTVSWFTMISAYEFIKWAFR